MKGVRLWVAAATTAGLVALVAACGDDGNANATLPPMATTTTTTTILTTTTFVQVIYVVQSGDSLQKIADAYQVSISSLMALNGIDNPDRIDVGDELKIPQGEVVQTELPTTTTTIASP